MPGQVVGDRVWPILRPILFFMFVLFPSIVFSLCFDGPIGVGYGRSALAGATAMLVLSLLLVGLADRRPIGSFGLRLDLLALRDLAIGMVIPAAQLGIIFATFLAMGWVRVRGCAWDGDIMRMACCRWTGVALIEELGSRGYLFQSLMTLGGRRFGPTLALGLTSVGFGWLHADNQGAHSLTTAAMMVIGAELGVAYLVTRRLWLPLGMHFAWNLIEGTLLGFPVSGANRPSILSIERSGPVSWTGGAYGPEASPLEVGLSLLDIALMLWLARLGFWRPDPFPIELERCGPTSTSPGGDGGGPTSGLSDESCSPPVLLRLM